MNMMQNGTDSLMLAFGQMSGGVFGGVLFDQARFQLGQIGGVVMFGPFALQKFDVEFAVLIDDFVDLGHAQNVWF